MSVASCRRNAPARCPSFSTRRNHFRLALEVALAPLQQNRTQIAQHFADAFAVLLHAVESQHHAHDEHLAELRRGSGLALHERIQPLEHALDNSIHVREDDLFLAAEMQINGAFADPDLLREVVDGHFLIAVAREQAIRRVENKVANVFLNGDGSHAD